MKVLKRKWDKTKAIKELRERKEFKKKSVKKNAGKCAFSGVQVAFACKKLKIKWFFGAKPVSKINRDRLAVDSQ